MLVHWLVFVLWHVLVRDPQRQVWALAHFGFQTRATAVSLQQAFAVSGRTATCRCWRTGRHNAFESGLRHEGDVLKVPW